MSLTTSLRQLVTALSLVAAAAPVFAASSVSITSAGNNAYILRGNAFTSATIVDVAISYDSTALSKPSITGGSLAGNAVATINTTAPGTVQLSIMGNAPMSGSGPLVTITFDRTGTSTGGVTAVRGNIVEGDGKHIPVAFTVAQTDAATIASASVPDASTTTPSTSGSTTDGTTTNGSTSGSGNGSTNGTTNTGSGNNDVAYTRAGSGAPVLGGSVTLPPDPLQKEETSREQETPSRHPDHEQVAAEHRVQAPEAAPQAPSTPQEQVAQQTATEKPEVASVVTLRSALERFALYKGERTVQSLVALLMQPQANFISQEPEVAISDGKGSVRVRVKLPTDKAPNFVFNAARAISVTAADGRWLLEAQPEKNALQVNVTVLSGSIIEELPLVVAPPANVDLDRSGQVTEADAELFLRGGGKEGAPQYDLNGDGKRDYVDDYIFFANYVAAHGSTEKQEKPGKGPQGKAVAVAASAK